MNSAGVGEIGGQLGRACAARFFDRALIRDGIGREIAGVGIGGVDDIAVQLQHALVVDGDVSFLFVVVATTQKFHRGADGVNNVTWAPEITKYRRVLCIVGNDCDIAVVGEGVSLKFDIGANELEHSGWEIERKVAVERKSPLPSPVSENLEESLSGGSKCAGNAGNRLDAQSTPRRHIQANRCPACHFQGAVA